VAHRGATNEDINSIFKSESLLKVPSLESTDLELPFGAALRRLATQLAALSKISPTILPLVGFKWTSGCLDR